MNDTLNGLRSSNWKLLPAAGNEWPVDVTLPVLWAGDVDSPSFIGASDNGHLTYANKS